MMEPRKGHETQLGKSKKIEKFLQLEERTKKLQKKQHLLGKERCGLSRNGALNKPRHSSDSRDRSQHQHGRDGREKRAEKLRMPQFQTDTSDEEEWEHFGSDYDCPTDDEKYESLVTARVINQNSPSCSESGGPSSRKGLRFTHVDINLQQGRGDEPLPHAVPILGLRSTKSSARTTRSSALSGMTSFRPSSVGTTARSIYTGASSKASSRSLSAKTSAKLPSSRNSSRLQARSDRAENSVSIHSAKIRTRSSSTESSDSSSSPRTYNVFPSNKTSARSLTQVSSSRAPHSAKSPLKFSEPVFPSNTNNNSARRMGTDSAQAPGYWENVSEERQGNLNSICVWALTDPPEPPPGIVWKKVTPPPSPGPSPETSIDSDVLTKDNHLEEVQQLDLSTSSTPIVPELIPSIDQAALAPKTVIRQVVVMPTQLGYPGFCDSSEALQTLKCKRSSSNENMGEKKRQLSSQKEGSKKKMNPKSKEPPVRLVANFRQSNKKNGIITPSSWRTGLKCVKKELGTWKPPAISANIEKKKESHRENSEHVLHEKLKHIRNYVDKTENKIADYKLLKANETKQNAVSSEVHIFHRETDKSENSKVEKSGGKNDVSILDDLTDMPDSPCNNVLTGASTKEDSQIINGKNIEQVEKNEVDEMKVNAKIIRQSRNHPKSANKRCLVTKSAHNLNNAFVVDSENVLPKRSYSMSNFSMKADSKGVSLSKCAQNSRHYDPQAIKEYIRTQKKLRHKKILEEKETKKMQDEKKRTKLLQLRSKSKELVEESLKKKTKCAKKELEFLQMFGMQLDEIALQPSLKANIRTPEDNTAFGNEELLLSVPAENKPPSHQHSNRSNSASEIPESLGVNVPPKLASPEPSDVNALPKSVNHVSLQTEEEFFKPVSESVRDKVVTEGDILISSLRPPSITCEPKLSISNANIIIDRKSNFNEKSGSSETESCRVVLDQKLCSSIQREVKKLSHNVYVLEKHKMIGIFPEKHAIPSTSTQREVPLKNSFETSEKLKSDLNNKNASLVEAERQMCNKTLDSSPMYCSDSVVPSNAQNSVNPIRLSLTSHCPIEWPSKTKSSVNKLMCENENSVRSQDTSDAIVKIQTLIKTKRDKNTPSKNNALPLLIPEVKQNRSSASDSFISEGPLNEEDIANVSKVIEPQSNIVRENGPFKNSEEKKKDEVPFWLRKPPMESHPFNFISAVKMKLNRFLEEQNKNILTEISSNGAQPPKSVLVQTSNGKESSIEEDGNRALEQEVQYESDFETSAQSGSLPSHNDGKVNAANSSDLDTATEEILPTDEIPQSKVPLPNAGIGRESIDSNSDNASETSKKSGSVASNPSRLSSGHQLVAPNFTLSRSGHDSIWKNLKDSESKSSTLQLENAHYSHKSNSGDGKSILSMPCAVLSNKSDQSTSYGSCKTEISAASKSGLTNAASSIPEIASKNKILPSPITFRKTLEGDLSSQFKEIVSSNSATCFEGLNSDRSHSSKNKSSHDGLHLPTKADIKLQPTIHVSHESETDVTKSSVLPHQSKVSSNKEMNAKHSLKLAEMELKAFEHRLEMERAFEKERQKLELALEEAKKTVFDSKLEATKFISDAAVELVRSQAEATRANAEATKHLSEAKVMDSLKLETISAQSASAAAFAAVQAAMKQLQSFKKVKHHAKKHAIQENSFPSTLSEASSSSSEEKSRNTSAERESEESSVVLEDMSEETEKVEKTRNAVSEVADVIETVEQSAQNAEKTIADDVGVIPEDSSLRSISENISEPEYSSKFDESASEGKLKAVPKSAEGNAVAVKIQVPETKGMAENKKVISHFRKKSEFKMDMHNLDSTNDTEVSLGSPQLNEESSNTDQDSFTKFSLSMFQQLMREEEMRAQHQQALLKLREDALIDKTKAEMILLELKKKQCRDKGQEDVTSSIRKKQRGLLMRLKLEKNEIERLKKSHKTASHERRMMLTQQQHIVRMRMSTREIMNKLQTKKLPATPKAIRSMGFRGSILDTSKSTVEINTEESALDSRSHSSVVPEEQHSVDVTHSDISLPTAPVHSSHASFSDSESHNSKKRDTRRLEKQVIHGLNDLERNKKFLSEREKNLIHRRQAVEELILWRKRLEQEEERVRALESQALAPHSQSFKAQPSFRSTQETSVFKADRSTSPLHLESSVEVKLREDAATSMVDLSSAHSSILEDVPIESQKSSLSVVDDVDSDSKKNRFANENFESSGSASAIKTQVSAEEHCKDSASEDGTKVNENSSKSVKSSILPLSAKEESKRSSLNITIKSPLTPYIPGRQKRRHSSGSDESIILSQNETASEQSDIEGKICALQEQLRRRKMEAELLKREQKRCHRERLKAKEQSLIKQIQAYDLYIQRARMELEQECESPTASLVKPQIKQPRVGEWKKKVEEPKEPLSEVAEKVSAVESVTEVIEKIPFESQTEVTEKTSALESLSDVAEKTPTLEFQQEESKNTPDLVYADTGQIKNNSSSSLSEVLEEIPVPTEELQVLENSQCSLSRGSSVETTIESPTKQDIVDTLIVSNVENETQPDIVSESVKDTSSKYDELQENVVSTIIETKSDKYDEDTFEPTTGSNVKVEETSVDKQNEKFESPECPISEEMMEELSYSGTFEKHDPFASEVSDVDNLILSKAADNEKGVVDSHHSEEVSANLKLEQASEESVSLPSHIFVEHTVPQLELEEMHVVSDKTIDNAIENEERVDQITEKIFKSLFEESVVEAEILMNKNSTSTMILPECNEKVAKLAPLYEVESYEEVIEQQFEEMESSSEDIMNVVNIYREEWKDKIYSSSEESNKTEIIPISSQVNVMSSLLLQLLLEDATTEMIKILEKHELYFKHKKEHATIIPDDCASPTATSDNKNSDVMKRVQQIMFESSLSQVSPREKSRPQDLMITTYDVLSPDSSNCSSPVLGQSYMEMVFAQEEKFSPKSSHKCQTGKAIQFLQVEHGGGLGASSAAGESAGAENEAFSEDWFEEDFGLNNSLREVEEIQLQRLQIEREIEQLQLAQAKEQQQRQYPYNFYIREIPNKPPPPYTPPEETPRISTSIAGPISPLGTPRDPSPRAAIPTDQEEVANFVRTAAGQFFDAWNRGESLDSVEPPPSLKFVPEEEEAYANDGGGDGDVRKKSRRAYSHFLFDLSRQLVDESLDNVEGEKWVSVPTKFGSRKLKPALSLPSRERFVEELEKQALVILGFIPRETRDNFMFSWTLKKRDHIDEILMREVQEEDRYWTNFDEEERYLKEQIAESLFELLLADTTKAVAVAYERRERRFSVVDG